MILTIFHQLINQNFGYFPHIELSVVPCYQYQLVLWIRSNFDSNSSINELKNDEIKDSSSTKYRFRRYPAKNFLNFLVVISDTFAMCDVSDQEVRLPDFTFASKQRHSEDVLKSSLCQLCKIYVISASKLFQFAGFHLVTFLELKATFILTYRQSFVDVMLGYYALPREGRLELGSVYSGAIPCID